MTDNFPPQVRYTALGWKAKTGLREGIALAYQDFLAANVQAYDKEKE